MDTMIQDSDNNTCDICGRSFNDLIALKRHLKFHKTSKRIYYCSECGMDFGYKIGIDFHMASHTGVRPYSCDLCQKRFTQRSTLNFHLRAHKGIKPHSCEVCGKKFQAKSRLKIHLQTKFCGRRKGSSPLGVKCAICSNVFTTKENLDQHMKTHEPFPCPVCDEIFIQKHNLTEHVQTHTPNICDACGKTFATKPELRNHISNHNDSKHKPFACGDCEEKFTSKLDYENHFQNKHRLLTDEDNRTCQICGQIFRTKGGADGHYMNMHHEKPKKLKCTLQMQESGTQFIANLSRDGTTKTMTRLLLDQVHIRYRNTSQMTSRLVDSQILTGNTSANYARHMPSKIRIIAEGDPQLPIKLEPPDDF